MDSSKRVADAKAPRKEAPSAELKRLAKFFAPDRPPRKRLRTLLDFLKSTGSEASAGGNIAVAVQSLLGASKDASSTANAGPEHAAAVAEFWADAANSTLVFGVVNDCVTELETLYAPHENAFRKQRRKPLEAEDWSEVFEGLEVLLRSNSARLREGWNNNGLTMLFAKLLKRDNHSMIKKYAFRCLALYTDATRNIQQLAAMPATSTSSFQASRAGSIRLMSDGVEIDIDEDGDDGRGTAMLSHTMPNRKNMHLELLRESVDFSPYGGGSIMLPDKFLNEGVHVEGWMRPMPTQAEEPVDMLKFLMDLSLEREDAHGKLAPLGATKTNGNSDRFIFWCELIMKFYMPLLYPKICLKVKLKEEGDTLGFFHHCPGSFQRVVARWVYKLRSKEDFMEVLWSRREFSEVVMETIRQRFAYRDTELVVDAIKFYSGVCTGAQYVPTVACLYIKKLFAQQQVEEASIEVQAAMEPLRAAVRLQHAEEAIIREQAGLQMRASLDNEPGHKPRTKPATSDAKNGRTPGIKLEARQVSWEHEQDILSNNVCPIKSSYVFHEDGSAGSASKENGDSKKKDKSRSSEIEKMPGSGNKDERQERLERIAKQHEERNNTGAQPTPEPQKTLLGGRYAMMRYNLMDLSPSTNPLLIDSAEPSGFSFLQRLIHDEECYAQLKSFLTKDENPEGKELVEFCDAVKKYERSSVPTDRLGQASVIYWEFLTIEGGKKLVFPTAVHAMAFVEYEGFEKSGLLDNKSSTPSIPPQLALFDSFSIMEVNARVSHLALQKRNLDEQLVRMTKPGGTGAERLIEVSSGSLKDSRTHRGFVGGLDTNPKSLSNGNATLYYASSHSELMYHVVTMMPTKPSDPQQIDKKRHVGNDYVHIVWSDNAAQVYDPSTITSHFNDVQIVIYPLRKAQRGLFLIKIHTKDKVPPFGPLQSGMVVHQVDLARLVRQTAMNANRVCRSQTMLDCDRNCERNCSISACMSSTVRKAERELEADLVWGKTPR
eukprot:jgi/Phyca11/14250/fgenesh1_pg.PHYCAscaffold_6_\